MKGKEDSQLSQSLGLIKHAGMVCKCQSGKNVIATYELDMQCHVFSLRLPTLGSILIRWTPWVHYSKKVFYMGDI